MTSAAHRAPLGALRRIHSGRVRPWRLASDILRPAALLASLLVAGTMGVVATSRVAAEGVQLSVVVEGGLVTVEARDAPLGDVLRAIGEQAGLTVVVEGDAARPVSISFDDLPIADSVRLLLREAPSAVIYRMSSGELAEIRVRLLGAGAPSSIPAGASPTAGPAEPAAAGPVGRSWATPLPQELDVTPDDPREDRLAFVRAAARAPRADRLDGLGLLLLEDEDATIRAAAAGALGRVRGRQAGERLAAALSDPDRRVRRAAARALGRVGDATAIDALQQALTQERVQAVRQMAAFALSRIADDSALDALETARFDRNRIVRNIAEAALTRDQD